MQPSSRAAAAPLQFEDLQPGDRAVLTKCFREEDVAAFAALFGDYNPLHMNSEFARRTRFGRRVVHGMLVASYVSTLVGMHLPGAGSLWGQQSFNWRRPVFLGETLDFALQVLQKSSGARALKIRITATNQNGTVVLDGEGVVTVPTLAPSL